MIGPSEWHIGPKNVDICTIVLCKANVIDLNPSGKQ